MKLPRYSLRTLLVVMTAFSVLFGLVGWVGWNAAQVRRRQAIYRQFEDHELDGIRRSRLLGEEPEVPLLWKFFGAKPQDQICLSREKYTDQQIREIEALFPEADIFVSDRHNFALPPIHWGARLKEDSR